MPSMLGSHAHGEACQSTITARDGDWAYDLLVHRRYLDVMPGNVRAGMGHRSFVMGGLASGEASASIGNMATRVKLYSDFNSFFVSARPLPPILTWEDLR